MDNKFKVSDRVQHLQGGAVLTVDAVIETDDGAYRYLCSWVEGKYPKSAEFAESNLLVAKPPKGGRVRKITGMG